MSIIKPIEHLKPTNSEAVEYVKGIAERYNPDTDVLILHFAPNSRSDAPPIPEEDRKPIELVVAGSQQDVMNFILAAIDQTKMDPMRVAMTILEAGIVYGRPETEEE